MAGPASSTQNAKDAKNDGANSASGGRTRQEKAGASGPYAEIMYLQRAIGNQAVGQWLARMEDEEESDSDEATEETETAAKEPSNGTETSAEQPTQSEEANLADFLDKPIEIAEGEAASSENEESSSQDKEEGSDDASLQPKLKVSQPNDTTEIEAEAVSQNVMTMAEPGEPPAPSQPGSDAGVQRKAKNSKSTTNAARQVLNNAGQPLDRATRDFMEPRFGQDFSQVRVHTGPEAAKSANAVNALAYTVGPDIVFAEGQYQPGSPDGQKLLAHELTHVVQQGHSDSADGEGGKMVAHRATPQIAREDKKATASPKTISLVQFQLYPLDKKMFIILQNTKAIEVKLLECDILPGTYNVQAQIEVVERGEGKPPKILVRNSASQAEIARMGPGAVFKFGAVSSLKPEAGAVYDTQTKTIPMTVEAFKSSPNQPDSVDKDRKLDPNKRKGNYDDPGAAGDKGELLEANAPPIPVTMDGLEKQPLGGIGAYTTRLHYSAEGHNTLSLALEQRNWVSYHWEVYNVTKAVQNKGKDDKERRKAAEESKLDPKEAREPTIWEGAKAGVKHADQEVDKQSERAKENLDKAVDQGELSGVLTNLVALVPALEGASRVVNVSKEVLHGFMDIYNPAFNERSIPWTEEGTFVIRVVARPDPEETKDGGFRQPAASVAVKAVTVMQPDALASSLLDDPDKEIKDLKDQISKTKDEVEKAKLQAQVDQLELQAHGSSTKVLEASLKGIEDKILKFRKKWAEYKMAADEDKKAGKNWTHLDDFEAELAQLEKQRDEIEAQLKLAQTKEKEMGGADMVFRPQATIASTLTGQSYNLLLQMSITPPEIGSNLYNSKIFDITTKSQAEEYTGSGETASAAVWAAFTNLAKHNGYGTGQLAVRIPENLPNIPNGQILNIEPKQVVIENLVQDTALVRQRLKDLETVISVLALAVPGAGTAVMIMAAGRASVNIARRVINGTFDIRDEETQADLMAIAMALFEGVAMIGELKVVQEGSTVFLRSVKTAGTVAKGANSALNEYQFIMGTKASFDQLIEINKKEAAGEISHTEAQHQRAEILAGVTFQSVAYGKGKYDEHMQKVKEGEGPKDHKTLPEEPNPEAPNKTTEKNYSSSGEDDNAPKSSKDDRVPNSEDGTLPPASDKQPIKSEDGTLPPASDKQPIKSEDGTLPPNEDKLPAESRPTEPEGKAPALPKTPGEETGPASEEKPGTGSEKLASDLESDAGSDRRAKLEAGNKAVMQGLLDEAGNWKQLLGALSRSTNEKLKTIAENLFKYREGISEELKKRFGAEAPPAASNELISDVDLATKGTNAGEDLLRAEDYMKKTYGDNWSEKFRMNFYTEAGRLTAYNEAMPHLTPQQQAEVLKTVTALTEKFNFARMLRNAEGDPAATKRVQENAKGVKFNLAEVESLAKMDEKTWQENRTRLLHEADALQEKYRDPNTTGPEKDQLAIDITKKQIEANFYIEEAYIGPGAGTKTVLGKTVTGHEAYQSALSDLEMIYHILHLAGGDVVKACREYELYKYVNRFTEASRTADVKSPELEAFERISARLYKGNRPAHSENPNEISPQAQREKIQNRGHDNKRKGREENPIPVPTGPEPGDMKPGYKPPEEPTLSPEFLQKFYDNFMNKANEVLPKIKEKAEESTATPDGGSSPAAPSSSGDPSMPVLKAPPGTIPPEKMPTNEEGPQTDRGMNTPPMDGPEPEPAPMSTAPDTERVPKSTATDTEQNSSEPGPNSSGELPPDTVTHRPNIPWALAGDRAEGYKLYNEFQQANPTLEAALWMDVNSGEYVAVQGQEREVLYDWMYEPSLAGRKWRIIEHVHPSESHMSRFASADDFHVMMTDNLRNPAEQSSIQTQIRWRNPENNEPVITTIGFDANVSGKPYWIRYEDYNGNGQYERFADNPWNPGSEYRAFLQRNQVVPRSE